MSSKYQIDLIFRKTLLLSKLFTKSWGNPETLKILKYIRDNYMSKGAAMEIIERKETKMIIKKEWKKNNILYIEGYFKSPLVNYSTSLFPDKKLEIASWKGLFPVDENLRKGVVVHLAGTGDHSFFRRELGFANDLINHGISSILLENPYYGSRKPVAQFRSSLLNVTDLFVMGALLITECCFLLKWAKEQGYYPLGLSGVSMGGHMASLAATNMQESVALIPLLSWTSAAPVYTLGALSEAVSWPILKKEVHSKKFYLAVQNKVQNSDWFDKLNDVKYLPHVTSKSKRFMWILMEEFTNLQMYPIPIDTSLVKSIVAENDAYILRNDIPDLSAIWPKSTVQVVLNKGHIETYFAAHSLFRETIRQAMIEASEKKPIPKS